MAAGFACQQLMRGTRSGVITPKSLLILLQSKFATISTNENIKHTTHQQVVGSIKIIPRTP